MMRRINAKRLAKEKMSENFPRILKAFLPYIIIEILMMAFVFNNSQLLFSTNSIGYHYSFSSSAIRGLTILAVVTFIIKIIEEMFYYGIRKDVLNDNLNYDSITKAFKSDKTMTIAGTIGWTNLYLTLWGFIPIVGSIIKIVKTYSYGLATFLLLKEDYPSEENVTVSRHMMEGHKLELFKFHLSFIGWYIAGILTFGIAYIWIIPYVAISETYFLDSLYNDIKADVA